jgi:hypothetical protein
MPSRRTAPTPGARFFSKLTKAAGKSATGIVVPTDVIERLGQGRRPAVRVSVNGYEFRTTIGSMDGNHMISVSAAIRKATGLEAGDNVDVEVTPDNTPREVVMPADLAQAFAAQPAASAFFATLSNSLQRYHVDNIEAAKSADTRQRRIDKAIALFLAQRPR